MRETYEEYLFHYFRGEHALSREAWKQAENAAYQRFVDVFYALAADPGNDFKSVIDRSDVTFYTTLFENAGIRRARNDGELFHLSRHLEAQINSHVNLLYPDAKPALDALRAAGYRLMVCTSASEAHLTGALKGCALTGFFEGLYYGERFNSFKDRPDFWKKCFAEANAAPGEILVVDDSAKYLSHPHDLGAHCLLLDRNGTADAAASPYPVVRSLTDLPALLQEAQRRG